MQTYLVIEIDYIKLMCNSESYVAGSVSPGAQYQSACVELTFTHPMMYHFIVIDLKCGVHKKTVRPTVHTYIIARQCN